MIVQPRPSEFVEIQENVYVHRRHSTKFSLEEADVCQCRVEAGVGCTESCLNRSLFTECVAGTCPCGDMCHNQRLQKRQWAKTSLRYFGEKGWGVVAEEPLAPGQLVVEYIGEVCDLAEVERRARRYEWLGLKNTYIMNLNSHEVIDATSVGNYSRFINHSCDPNAECQKWTVKGEQRIAIFATQEIAIGEEITYNYNLDWNGGRRVKCQCGAEHCTGFLGAESVLWRKTAQAVTKKRMLFSDCFASPESFDVDSPSVPSSSPEETQLETDDVGVVMCNPVALCIPNAVIVPRTVVTRSKGLPKVDEMAVGNGFSPAIHHKRRKVNTDPDSVQSGNTKEESPVKPSVTPVKKKRPSKKPGATSPAPFQPRQYPLRPIRPLPRKFDLDAPPQPPDPNKKFHPLLLSVTDAVPLPELLCDPFLICNQEYYLAMADLSLMGLLV